MSAVKGLLLVSLYGMVCGEIVLGDQDEAGPSTEAALGAETFVERQLAANQLWERGPEAVNLLNAMALSDDPEESWRARQILRWVDLEMTPDTPDEIVELVERYLIAANAQDRERIYGDLLAKEAYVQLFRLPKHVSDEVVSRNLAERVAELAGEVAEEKILSGDDEEALAILEDAKNAKAGHLRWVALASALGKKDELWDELSEDDQMRFARWEGDVELIRTLAGPDHEVQLSLQLLDGEVLPFLTKQATRNDSMGIRARIAKGLLTGKVKDAKDSLLKPLLAALEENGVDESEDVLVLLAQMGFAEEALPYFEKSYPIDMFEYYQGTERLEDALRCLSLEVGKPIPAEWIEEALAKVKDEFELENEGCRRLLSVGQFLVERGEIDEAEKVFEALYSRMEKEGVNEVNNLLAFLGGRQSDSLQTGYPEFAVRKASEREEEVFRPENFLSETFYTDESSFLLLRFLEGRDVEMAEWKRVRAVFSLFGRQVSFPKDELETILAEFEMSAETNASEAEWTVLMQSAMARGDIPLLERSIRALIDIVENKENMTANLASLLFSDGRFEESSQILNELVEADPRGFHLMESLAIVLELAGRGEEAERWLTKLEKLALGDGAWLFSLGETWGELGNWKRQHELNQRAFLLFPAESSGWIRHLYYLSESARKAGLWKQAAACREAYNTYLNFEIYGNPMGYFRGRGQLDFSRAMAAFEEGDMAGGDRILNRMVSYCAHDSFFADDVFPVLRLAGLHEQVERVWAHVSPFYRHSMKSYPKAHNAHNTAAWVASRAACDLDEALIWVDEALKGKPGGSAYQDTRGEVLFAQGKRKEALKWSEKACQSSDGVGTLAMLRVQYRHFRDDPFPLTKDEVELPKDEELPAREE
ncbi:MAG: tetratricopeptide repeat protein [Roseibacillus sp.]